MENKNNKVAVIGAGLCGCTLAILLQKKGFDVDVYEKHTENEISSSTGKRSINLFLSKRAEIALTEAGIWEDVKKVSVPVVGRYYHLINNKEVIGEKEKAQKYSHLEEYNYSIMRSDLNEILFNKTKEFLQKDLKTGDRIDFSKLSELKHEYSAVICADGLGHIQAEMLRSHILNEDEYDVTPYEYSYFEIKIKKNGFLDSDAFRYEKEGNSDYLHIWSLGNNFMIIALPNVDNSHNCIVFFPNNIFGEKSPKVLKYEEWSELIKEKFNDKDLAEEFLSACEECETCEDCKTNVSQLKDLKCERWVDENLLMIGDCSHAVLPFHGQGANAAMEDAKILYEMLPDLNESEEEFEWNEIFKEFFLTRKPDADALLELAREFHFSLIGTKNGAEKSKVLLQLAKVFPDDFESEYHMVTFSNQPYSKALERYKDEDSLFEYINTNKTEIKNKLLNDKPLTPAERDEIKGLIKKNINLESTGDEFPNDEYWWNYKLDWSGNEHEPKDSENIADNIKKLKKFKNLNKSIKPNPNGKRYNEDKFHPSYASYIRPKEIISQQIPVSTNPDERVFIIVHEMYELVMKQMIFDFDVVARTLSVLLTKNREEFEKLISTNIPIHFESYNQFLAKKDESNFFNLDSEQEKDILFWQAAYFASNRLMISVEKMLNVLSYYLDISAFSGLQFAQFRPLLLPASGFQTEQFRTIQIILGKKKCHSPKFFGAHEYYKKYFDDAEAWKRTAEQDKDKAESFFKSIIDKSIYKKAEAQKTDWETSGAKYAFELCETVTEVLRKIGASVTSELINEEKSRYERFKPLEFNKQKKAEDLMRKSKSQSVIDFSNQFLDHSDPLMPNDAEKEKREEWENKIKSVREFVENEIKTNLEENVEEHFENYFNEEARKGMQKIASEYRDSFLLHILRNLSLTDGYIHAMDYSKRNRDRTLRTSVIKRPFFSFLERHLDFIDNQISMVIEYEKAGGGKAVGGTGGGGKNYFEFAMRLYELFPAFPAVDEHIVK